MCRFIVYKGTAPIRLSDLVTKPIHSITNQTFDSRLRFTSSRPFNADGFGIGYYESGNACSSDLYDFSNGQEREIQGTSECRSYPGECSVVASGPARCSDAGRQEGFDALKDEQVRRQAEDHEHEEVQIGPEKIKGSERVKAKLELAAIESERPGLFKSIHPAWSNANLSRLAEKIKSPLIFAHVRASTMAGAPSEDNCHPWAFGKLMWMHNGGIADFELIKRKLQASLSDELFLFPSGYTDSEWSFALFLSKLADPHARKFSTIELRTAMLETIAHINQMTAEVSTSTGHKFPPHLMNFVVSDGENVVATRYVSSTTDEASSLFFSSGTTFEEYAEGGHYKMTKADKRENIIMIASEPLTFEQRDWMEVKNNTMVVITPKMNLLQIPIRDEFHVPPEVSVVRSGDYAIAQGYGHGFAASGCVHISGQECGTSSSLSMGSAAVANERLMGLT